MEKLVEAIKEGEIVRVSERQARDEDLFILRGASVVDFEEHALPVGKELRERKGKVVDFTQKHKRELSPLETWRKGTYKKNNVLNDLKHNFHWDIIKIRRGRGLSRRQFAELLGEKEESIKIVENGGLPEDNFFLINKIEKTLGLELRKNRPIESQVNLAQLQKIQEQKAKETADKMKKVGEGDLGEGLFGEGIEVID